MLPETSPKTTRNLPLLLIVGGAVGLAAAFTLMVEKIQLLSDPTYVPSCSINAVLSCGPVMSSDQAGVFGFPNPLLGIAGFAMVITTGAALLGGARLSAGYWIALQLGVSAGFAFVHWLIFQTLYRIGALCPYCMAVWVVTAAIFWFVTLNNLNNLDSLRSLAKSRPWAEKLSEAAQSVPAVPLVLWYLSVFVLVMIRFWEAFVDLV